MIDNNDRQYKPTTHGSPTPVSWVSETRCHYTSPGQDVRPGWSGEGGGDWCVWACRRFSVARQRDACGGLLQRKQGQTQRVNWHAIFRYAEWPFDNRISICATDISFIGYRLTSLFATKYHIFWLWKCVNACYTVISKVFKSISGGLKLLTLNKNSSYL